MSFVILLFIIFFYKLFSADSKVAVIENCNLPEYYACKIQLNDKRISFQFDNSDKSIFISKSQGFLVPSGSGDFIESENQKIISQNTCYTEKSDFCYYINIFRKYSGTESNYNCKESKDKFEVTFYIEKLGDGTCSSDVMQKTYSEVNTLKEIAPEFEKMVFEIIDSKDFYSFFKTGQK